MATRLRPATREERQLAMLWAAAAISVSVLRPVWIAVAPHLGSCTFRNLTGIPCPSCGTTRTALALLDFDIGAALAVNPLAAIVGVAFIIGGGLALIWVVARGPIPTFNLRWSRWWTAAVVAAILINWVYLILTD
jgi:Protein of unknown function (DUF2752)